MLVLEDAFQKSWKKVWWDGPIKGCDVDARC